MFQHCLETITNRPEVHEDVKRTRSLGNAYLFSSKTVIMSSFQNTTDQNI